MAPICQKADTIAPSHVCSRCGLHDETFLHCVRDIAHSRSIWQRSGFIHNDFFSTSVTHEWLKNNSVGHLSFTFAATIWRACSNRNMMCLRNENWTPNYISYNIQGIVDTLKISFPSSRNSDMEDRFFKWNHQNHSKVILNIDGSCLVSPIRAGYGGVLINDAGFYLSGFSGYIHNSSDILYAELYAIYQGLLLAKDKCIVDLICYFDSLLCINIITGPFFKFHVYAVLVQDIKELMEQVQATISHALREGNHCADFLAKLGATSNIDLIRHDSPPSKLLPLFRNDATGTFYMRH